MTLIVFLCPVFQEDKTELEFMCSKYYIHEHYDYSHGIVILQQGKKLDFLKKYKYNKNI